MFGGKGHSSHCHKLCCLLYCPEFTVKIMLTVVLPSISARIYGQDNVNCSVYFVHLLVVISENDHYCVVFVHLL